MSNHDDLKRLALIGAKARLEAIQRERAAILALLPELRQPTSTGMSTAQRKAVSERMTTYWAKRRLAKK